MKAVFADTWFWIALSNEADNYNAQALHLRKTLSHQYIVTTEEILVEFLTYFSSKGPEGRVKATQVVEAMMESDIEILHQSHDSFIKGLTLYKVRPDKGYSLTDCISMQTMKAMAIQEALTHDHHFTQESFKILLN